MFRFLKANPSREDVALCIQWIIEGKPHVWDDFTGVPIQDPKLDGIRLKVLALEDTHPATSKDAYLSAAGLAILERLLVELRAELQ